MRPIVRDLLRATAAKQVPRRDWYASATFRIRILIYLSLWFMAHQPVTYEMKHESAQSLIRIG